MTAMTREQTLRAACVAIVLFAPPLAQAETLDPARTAIIDGDSIAVGAERMRIMNIDAPETRAARCEAELIKGLAAKARLAEIIRAGGVTVDRCEPDTGRCHDRYGRALVNLTTPAGADIGHVLIAEGHALHWAPGHRAKWARINIWCGRP